MTPAEFIEWRTLLGISRAEAGRRLGVHANSMTNYEKGRSDIPLTVALACTAVLWGMSPWPHVSIPSRLRKKEGTSS